MIEKIVAVHGLKLEIRNLGEMKRIYDLYDYKQAKFLISDLVIYS